MQLQPIREKEGGGADKSLVSIFGASSIEATYKDDRRNPISEPRNSSNERNIVSSSFGTKFAYGWDLEEKKLTWLVKVRKSKVGLMMLLTFASLGMSMIHIIQTSGVRDAAVRHGKQYRTHGNNDYSIISKNEHTTIGGSSVVTMNTAQSRIAAPAEFIKNCEENQCCGGQRSFLTSPPPTEHTNLTQYHYNYYWGAPFGKLLLHSTQCIFFILCS